MRDLVREVVGATDVVSSRGSAEAGSKGGVGPAVSGPSVAGADAQAERITTTATVRAKRVIRQSSSSAGCLCPQLPRAHDTCHHRGRAPCSAKAFVQSDRLADLRHAGYTGMTVSMAGGARRMSGGRHALERNPGIGAGVGPADRGRAGRPAGLRLVRTATATTTPKRRRKPLGPVREGHRRHAQPRCSRTTTPRTRRWWQEPGTTWRTRVDTDAKDWVDLDVLQPWDTSLIPNSGRAEPQADDGRSVRRAALRAARLGVHRTVRTSTTSTAATRRSTCSSTSGTRARSRIDTLNMMVVAAYALGIENPWEMTDEIAEVRDFISKKGPVRFYWNQSFDFWRAFKTEEVWAGYSWLRHGRVRRRGRHELPVHAAEGRPHPRGSAASGCSRSPRTIVIVEYVDSGWAMRR